MTDSNIAEILDECWFKLDGEIKGTQIDPAKVFIQFAFSVADVTNCGSCVQLRADDLEKHFQLNVDKFRKGWRGE